MTLLKRVLACLLALPVLWTSLAANAAPRVPDSETLFTWAQQNYPTVFNGSATTQTGATFTYRAYTSQNFLAVSSDGGVYVLGPVTQNQLVKVGLLPDFACFVYPESCVVAPLPVVSAITAPAALSYSNVGVVQVAGTALDQGVAVTAQGCSPFTEQAGGSATLRTFNCTVSVATQIAVTAKDSGGKTLLAQTLGVPDPQVTITTNYGALVFELNPAKAPISVNNFLRYVREGFYPGTIFHRVINTFVSQGGGFTPALVQKATNPPIFLESANGLSNLRGTVAMARTNVLDSATSQFYINNVDNKFLDATPGVRGGYAVFGQVVQGLAVVDTIRAVPTGTRAGFADVPVTDVVMQTVVQTR